MGLTEKLTDPAVVLALAQSVCPSLNGPKSHHLALGVEAIGAGSVDNDYDDIRVALEELTAQQVDVARLVIDGLGGARLVTVLDDEYPVNLRMIYNHPPFLFVRGSLLVEDNRAVAIVGTRNPSEAGVRTACRLAQCLAEHDVTVVSGMAKGIDTAAHKGALKAGGRPVAVFGTGINRVYPTENRGLADAISGSGATVSQFMPDMTATRWSFPVRNIVTSGMSVGTVVIEAGATSGTRQQTEQALKHGKRVFLTRDLVAAQSWAKELLDRPGVSLVKDVDAPDEILEAIDLETDCTDGVLV